MNQSHDRIGRLGRVHISEKFDTLMNHLKESFLFTGRVYQQWRTSTWSCNDWDTLPVLLTLCEGNPLITSELNKQLMICKTMMQMWRQYDHFYKYGGLRLHYVQRSTVYPKKYAHGFCCAVLCCGYTLTDFPISIRLTSLALWQSNDCPSASKATLMNMDKYFMWIHYERLHNHNKTKHNKTVCIFLGIYCMHTVPALLCFVVAWYY